MLGLRRPVKPFSRREVKVQTTQLLFAAHHTPNGSASTSLPNCCKALHLVVTILLSIAAYMRFQTLQCSWEFAQSAQLQEEVL